MYNKKQRKGIILAGGSGSRLKPLTDTYCKQLLPIYSKPMVYYPLGILLLAGITDILIITSPENIDAFKKLLKDGKFLGINISYSIQEQPRGIAEALLIAEPFLNGQSCCLILGDNILFGNDLSRILQNATNSDHNRIFLSRVKNPSEFGVAVLSQNDELIDLVEKPQSYISDLAIPGIYFYENNVVNKAKTLTPGKRGELEITDLNKLLLGANSLSFSKLQRGIAWMDTGTFENLADAWNFVRSIEKSQGTLVCSPEEIAVNMGFIPKDEVMKHCGKFSNSGYYEAVIRALE